MPLDPSGGEGYSGLRFGSGGFPAEPFRDGTDPRPREGGAIRRIRFLALVFALVTLLAGCAASLNPLPDPAVHLTSVDVSRLSTDSVTLRWNLVVDNPHWVSVPVESFRYEIDVEGEPVLSGESDTRITVPASTSHRFSISTEVPHDRVVSRLGAFSAGDLIPYRGTADLTVGLPLGGSASTRISREGEFPLPAVPEVSIEKLSVNEMGFSRTEAEASVVLHNNNSFDLTVDAFRVNLSLEGNPVLQQTLREPRTIPAGERESFRIQISFSPTAMGQDLFEALRAREVGFRLRGNLEVDTRFGRLQMPLDERGVIPFSEL